MLRTFASIFLFALPWASTVTATAAPNVDSALHDRLDRYLQQLAAEGLAGVVLVARGDQIVLHEGYGLADRERGLAMPRDAVFTVGSIAKPFTATAILRLEQAGLLDVDAPISRYLPNVPADKGAITLHHLLTHSSGWPGAIGHDFDFVDRDTFLARALAEPLLFEPGRRYEYSNVGYSVLAAVIERVTERPYREVLRQQVLAPAGLDETGFDAARWPTERLARGYRDGERWGTVVERFDARGPSWHLLGNGGLHSTVLDLWAFHRALLDERLLSAASKAKAFARQIPENAAGTSHYGYGWAVSQTPLSDRRVAHNGGNQVFFADFQRDLDNELTILLGVSQMIRGVQDLGNTLARMALDPNFEPVVARAESIRVAEAAPDSDALTAAWRLHDTRQGRAAARFLEAVVSHDENRRHALTQDLFAQRLIDHVGLDGLRGMVAQLRADLGQFELESAVRRGDRRVELVLASATTGERLLLGLSFEDEAPHGIVGVEVDGID